MAVNKIKISANTRKVLNKTKEILGIQGENMKDVLFFALSEKIDGTAVVEIELPNGVQSFVELIKVEDGYELPVKSVLTEQAGFVKFQLRILQNKVEVFKSEIFELEVKESLNAIYEEPEEYPTWLDKLEDLQTELNNSEKERISNENERIESEEARKENFTQMQESVKGAISNIKDLTENYNLNATEKTNKFDENYTEKKKAFDDNYSETLKSFNDNAETKYDNYNKNAENKTSEYNKNNDEKLKAYNDNHTTKITNFDTNAKNKTDEYNSNASKKLDDYNSNDTTKTEKYNENATTKLSDYNSNATAKKKEYDTNAENKIVEFNNNATEKLDEYNQNAESLTNRVIECESENERLRNDIKSIAVVNEVSGENIHIEDSSDARCEIEIGGNHQQDTREGYNLLNNDDLNLSSKTLQTKRKLKIDANTEYSIVSEKEFTDVAVNAFSDDINYEKLILTKEKQNKQYYYKFTTKSDTQTIYFYVVSADEYTNVNDFVNSTKLMLIKGSKAIDYEQYGASPSIDFPSELKAVGDDINILNDTIFARKGYYSGIVGATTQKANTTIRLLTDEDINVISNKDITISLGTDKDLKYNVFEIDENDVIIKNNMSSNNKDKTIKLQENTKKISLMLMWQDANKTITLEDIKDCKIKIAYGTRISNYSSYNCGSAKIDIFNKNFIDIDKLKSLNSRNAYEKYNNVECLKLAGVTQRYNLNCKQNTQYVFQVNIVGYTYTSKLIGQFLIAYTDGSTSYMQTDGTNAGKYSLISKAGKTVKALVWNGYSSGHFAYIDKNDIQLDEATTLTNIVQHEEQSYLVDVQQEMLKGDTFVRKDGKWYEKHCVKTEIMLTFPTTNIEVCGTFANFQINRNIAFAVVKNDLKITNVRNDILCDKLKAKDNSMWGGKEDGIQTYINSNKFMISIPFEDIEKNFGEELTINNYSQAFRKYINDNGPFKIYYFLEEPKLLECTETQSKVLDEIYNKAHTYKNITNISAESSEVNPIASVKYLKDPETEHNKLQAQINEIKELLSSTETSSLLLDNIQKDLESEV